MRAAWSPLSRHCAVFELPREDAGACAEASSRLPQADQIQDSNELSDSDALALVLSIRARALHSQLPDSTAIIRADRDGR